jgi:DNA modification methylase
MSAVKRVLRPDGTLWLNIGDSYGGSGKGQTGHNGIGNQEQRQGFIGSKRDTVVRPKSLALIPERLALALADDGWIIRSRIAWCKASPMPESTQDRPTSAWEHIWLLTRQERYFYDSFAVRTPLKAPLAHCRVLDPFLGSGTTALAASRLGRDAVGIELNPEYALLAERRIRDDAPLLADVTTA